MLFIAILGFILLLILAIAAFFGICAAGIRVFEDGEVVSSIVLFIVSVLALTGILMGFVKIIQTTDKPCESNQSQVSKRVGKTTTSKCVPDSDVRDLFND